MKKALLTLLAVLSLLSAYGQAPDTTSTVVGGKLNFELPLFNITQQDMIPRWSIVAFDEISGGWNYMPGAPGVMKPSGFYGDLSFLALRYRPWKDGNLFSMGLVFGLSMNRLKKGWSFADDGVLIPTPSGWEKTKSWFSEQSIGLQTGYVREFGDWKAGLFVVPSLAMIQLRNEYSIQGISGLKRQDNMNTAYDFRMGFKAGIWYQNCGVSVGYRLVLGKNNGPVPQYNAFQLGISVRY